MAFHDVSFPDSISLRSIAAARWRTDIVEGRSGHEDRNSPWAHARRRFEVTVPAGKHTAREALRDFFHGRRGPKYSFRVKDHSDYKSSAADQAITPSDQVLGTGDGIKVAFQLVKLYDGAGPDPYTRTITKPVSGTVRISFDDVEQFSGFTVDVLTGIVTFSVAPGVGVVVKAGFKFDVPARFEDEELPAEFLRGDKGGDDGSSVIQYSDVTLIEVRE